MTTLHRSRAIVFPSTDTTEIQEYDAPRAGPGEILVRTEYTGVSQGTEVWALIGKRPELTYPTVPGYQAVGVIEALGEGVAGYEVGQRVLWHHSRLPEPWPETWMAGHVSLGAVPVGNNPPPRIVPEEVDPVEAALAAMAAVSLRGIDMLKVKAGDLCVVTGQGLIGQAAAQLARLSGATVVATDISPKRLEMSKVYSADIVVNPLEQDVGEVVKALRPAGVDLVIDTTGRSEAFAECIDLLRWEGQFLMQGYYPTPVTFDFHTTHLKKPTIAVSCGIGDTGRVLELMRYRKLRWRELVTHLVPIHEAPALYARMAKADPDILGVVFDWKETA